MTTARKGTCAVARHLARDTTIVTTGLAKRIAAHHDVPLVLALDSPGVTCHRIRLPGTGSPQSETLISIVCGIVASLRQCGSHRAALPHTQGDSNTELVDASVDAVQRLDNRIERSVAKACPVTAD